MRRAWLLIALAGCGTEDNEPGDVVGPFTGETRRFVVDEIVLPINNNVARAMGRDLNGDKTVDNQLGQLCSTLAGEDNLNLHGAEMIAAGTIASFVEIRANDFRNDSTVSVMYFGASGDPATLAGGVFDNGVFNSNRTLTTLVPGAARLHLPLYAGADPIVVDLARMQIDLAPDGNGGYDAAIQGVVDDPVTPAYPGLVQLVENEPHSHFGLINLFDANNDWTITFEEFVTNPLIESWLAPDVTIQGQKSVSFGFRVHLSPCSNGNCVAPTATCFDRAKNGDETDVDCGGSCSRCVATRSCSNGSDCTTGACDGGTCGPASCTNSFHDGFETDLDCGSQCGPCVIGKRCYVNSDCTSNLCGEQCTDENPFACIRFGTDTCRSPG